MYTCSERAKERLKKKANNIHLYANLFKVQFPVKNRNSATWQLYKNSHLSIFFYLNNCLKPIEHRVPAFKPVLLIVYFSFLFVQFWEE